MAIMGGSIGETDMKATVTFEYEIDGPCEDERQAFWEWFSQNCPGGGEIDDCIVCIESFELDG
jgi:hypothetical protein